MQEENSKLLYRTIGQLITRIREEKGVKYTDFCYGNDIPMSTYDMIVSGTTQATFFNITKIIKALGLTFEEFGALLDKELPENFMNTLD